MWSLSWPWFFGICKVAHAMPTKLASWSVVPVSRMNMSSLEGRCTPPCPWAIIAVFPTLLGTKRSIQIIQYIDMQIKNKLLGTMRDRLVSCDPSAPFARGRRLPTIMGFSIKFDLWMNDKRLSRSNITSVVIVWRVNITGPCLKSFGTDRPFSCATDVGLQSFSPWSLKSVRNAKRSSNCLEQSEH